MFSKVFKYDFRFVFRIWWIFAAVITGLSVVGGVLLRGLVSLSTSNLDNFLLSTFIGFGFLSVIVSLCIFPLASLITCLVRYYKNFFSDEGYLTFTLPIKRVTLLNSKILMFFLFNVMNIAVIILDVLLILLITAPEALGDLVQDFQLNILPAILNEWDFWHTACAILLPLQSLISALAGIMIMFLSITIGSVITKKHKIIAGVGVYLGINAVISFFQQIIQTFTVNSLLNSTLYFLEIGRVSAPLAGYLFFTVILNIGVTLIAYFINLYLINQKLNLN